MGFWEHTSSETLKWLLCACASGEQQELWHRYKETRCIAHENKRWPKRLGPPSDADWMVWCNLMFQVFTFWMVGVNLSWWTDSSKKKKKSIMMKLHSESER